MNSGHGYTDNQHFVVEQNEKSIRNFRTFTSCTMFFSNFYCYYFQNVCDHKELRYRKELNKASKVSGSWL